MQENCPSCKVHRGHRAGCPQLELEELRARVQTLEALRRGAPLERIAQLDQGHSATIAAAYPPGDFSLAAYRKFLRAKCNLPAEFGVPVELEEIQIKYDSGFELKPHQAVGIAWASKGGRRALFESFGLGKTIQQLLILRTILNWLKKHREQDGRALITAPLGVVQEFKSDAAKVGIDLHFVQKTEEVGGPGIYLTNYQSVRDGKLDISLFTVTSLDEASVLRSFGGTKTFREFMRLYENVPYRYVATATPDPNEYIELLAYAAYLGIMDVSQAKTRFFKRDSTKADVLTLHPHKVKEFWLWCSGWGLFLNRPSDLGFSDDGYAIPEMEIVYHEVKVDHSTAPPEKDGQGRLYREASHGVVDASREKRDTIQERVEKVCEIIDAEPDKHFLIWHDLEDERKAIEKAVPGVVSVFGQQRSKKQDLAKLEAAIIDFSEGRIQYLAAKPSMFGAGANFQRHCSDAIFCGIGFKFNDFIQACHRILRFLQTKKVRIHLIYAESEKLILQNLLGKWERHRAQASRMSEIIREYGLSQAAMSNALARQMGVERTEVTTEYTRLINNDTVEEIHADSETAMPSESVDLILTSIPFSTQYEYTPSYNDFGHTDGNEHFFQQMDFLTPQLFRVLKPGRDCLIHVKDRIVPGGITGLGFQTVYPFHCRTIDHFVKYGFGFMGMKTIVTDVVRENEQTHRLGWTEQCKDGTKMGYGMSEYLLLFRKPPTDTTNSYADQPVVKNKPLCTDEAGNVLPYDKNRADLTIIPNSGYSRARWQLDAHGFARSSGNRLLMPEELEGIAHHAIYKRFRDFSKHNVYDYEHHVAIGESLEQKRILPSGFMLLPPQSWHPDVWTDITRMRTLNGAQSAKGREMHLCPMQLDLAKRVIRQNCAEGELVFDPFGGLMTVAMCAVELKRKSISSELNTRYWQDGIRYVKAAEEKLNAPTLFDITEWVPKTGEEEAEILESVPPEAD